MKSTNLVFVLRRLRLAASAKAESCDVKRRTSADEGARVPALETSSPASVAGCDAKSRSLTLSTCLVLVPERLGDAKFLKHIDPLTAVLGTSPVDEVTDEK